MRAMILAAGRGERMRPLTDHTPKPLLHVDGKPLIVWHLERLAAAGIRDIVINHAWLGAQLIAYLGQGERYGVRIQYSAETQALETAGGIVQALPALGPAPFLVINGDIWCDWDPAAAPDLARNVNAAGNQAWLLLVDNPVQHPQGDFHLNADGRADATGEPRLTFAGIGIYHPALFSGLTVGQRTALAPVLRQAMSRGSVRGARHSGRWVDVGTPERLAALQTQPNPAAG